jgi:phenylacetate-coenzyme A ligase PaaK-like adenylate-forming protein
MAIEAIEGRSDDILIFRNIENQEVKIFPDFFRRAIILSDNTIIDYALIQTEPHRLILYTKSKNEESFQMACGAIQELLKKNNIFTVEISQTNHNHTLKGQKLRRIKNNVRKTN